MKYFVLGSNSFAGSTFVDEMLSQDEEIIGVSRSVESSPVLRPYADHPKVKNFRFYALDLNQNLDEIKSLVLQYKPRYVVDFAGQGMVAESWKNPEQWYSTNVVAKVKLHDFLRTCDFMERYVRISTPEVYGHSNQMLCEDQAFNPSTPYAVSHAAIDMSLMAFYKQYGFPVLFTRYANFYGPHQQLYRIIPRTIIYSFLGKKLLLQGGGTTKRAFIYGTDVAEAIRAAIQHGKPGESYHFSSGDCISIASLVQQICTLLHVNYQEFVQLAPDRPGKDAQYLMDTTKAQSQLHWQPRINLEQGLQKTIHWVAQNIELIKALPLEYIHKP